MAHLSGTYTYTFSRLDPMYNNSLKTGVQSLVVGLKLVNLAVLMKMESLLLKAHISMAQLDLPIGLTLFLIIQRLA